MPLESWLRGIVSRAQPAPSVDDPDRATAIRLGRYRDQMVVSPYMTKHALADEGAYFMATNPTPGTGIQLAANVTAFSDTNALFVVGNLAAPGPQAPSINLDVLRLILLATAPTATVSMQFAFKKSTISREPTTAANRTVLTPVNMRGGLGRASVARVLSYAVAGAMTVPASLVSDPVLDRVSVPTGLGAAGDEYVVKFGGEDMVAKPGLTAVRATDVARVVSHAAPIILDPGEWAVIHMWWLTAATTAATFEFSLGWFER